MKRIEKSGIQKRSGFYLMRCLTLVERFVMVVVTLCGVRLANDIKEENFPAPFLMELGRWWRLAATVRTAIVIMTVYKHLMFFSVRCDHDIALLLMLRVRTMVPPLAT